jgi:protocatechuate 3,4-dioxygenase beta subunit/thiol-disulfide isomerase/thioredoxin
VPELCRTWGMRLLSLSVLVSVGCAGLTSSISFAGEKEPARPAENRAISGKVVDSQGRPVGGARVGVYRFETVTGRRGRLISAGEPVTTSATGAYAIENLAAGWYTISVEHKEKARVFRLVSLEGEAAPNTDVILGRPISPVIRVTDPEGKPLAGARVREIKQSGANGYYYLSQVGLKSLGVANPASNDDGRLQLPPFAEGEVLKLILDHPNFAPTKIEGLKVAEGAATDASMQPGVALNLKLIPADPADRTTRAQIDLHHQNSNPSTIVCAEVEFVHQGSARLMVEPGECSCLWLQHEEFLITPFYEALTIPRGPERRLDLTFDVRRKVPVRGRIIDAETGRPVAGASVHGEIANLPPRDPSEKLPSAWSHAGYAETNEQGEYTLMLAAGTGRVTMQSEKLISDVETLEIAVSADATTTVPDIKVRPLPKIVGEVRYADGRPASRMVVRLRGKQINVMLPVLTDAQGRFEFHPDFVPIDYETKARSMLQHVVAFDPHSPLAAKAEVHLGKPEHLVLTLEPRPLDWPLTEFAKHLSAWERGEVTHEVAEKNRAISLKGRAPPELDCIEWLNIDQTSLRLKDLRGKFVLLDFWFVGCGPCHYDFPSVELVHELYKDRGVVVIGVHNNRHSPAEVRAHVKKIGLPFPIAIDYPDGRTISSLEPYGLPEGYPQYVLIGPDGKVLLDDKTIPHPTLRGYKLEIIRQRVLEAAP